jgi:hypothetical protein
MTGCWNTAGRLRIVVTEDVTRGAGLGIAQAEHVHRRSNPTARPASA